MKTLLILGAGTAGTMMANHLRRKLPESAWRIRMIDQNPDHYYQPGFLFMPFDIYSEKDVIRPKRRFVPRGVEYIEAAISRIDADSNRVLLTDGRSAAYDILIIATGVSPAPDQVEGMLNESWRKDVHEFYTFEGAVALGERLRGWKGGRLVIHICEMPIKCSVAPLEFAFLTDSWLTEHGLREKTEIVYVTPLSGAFTKPIASGILGHLLEEKRISVVHDFSIANVDSGRRRIVSWDDKEVPYRPACDRPTQYGRRDD